MRRKDREITDVNEKLAVLKECKVCRLGLSVNDEPYIVPLNFGYTFADNALTLYFHGAAEGKKIDMLRANPKACFEMDTGHELIRADEAANFSFHYVSLIGFGEVSFISGTEEKRRALNELMRHQTGKDEPFALSDAAIEHVVVYKLAVHDFTGKKH